MAIPQWMNKKAIHVCHSANTLREAARVIRLDAKAYRKENNKEGARVAEQIAARLLQVADDKTWADAFDL